MPLRFSSSERTTTITLYAWANARQLLCLVPKLPASLSGDSAAFSLRAMPTRRPSRPSIASAPSQGYGALCVV